MTIRAFMLAATVLGATACGASTEPEFDPTLCHQTYEFGNFGCARIVAVVEPPPPPLPSDFLYSVRAVPARSNSGAVTAFANPPAQGGANLIEITDWGAPVAVRTVGDTLSVWVVARLNDRSAPVTPGVPQPPFAADSVLRLIRFSPVGSPALVDTVHLTLRRQ
jgi:hypothetical protein